MKTLKRFFVTAFVATAMIASSCTSDNTEVFEYVEEQSEQLYTCPMHFEGSIDQYGAETRAEAHTWKNNDKLYIRFINGTDTINGYAIYSTTTSQWNVSYAGTIAANQDAKCEVYYFEGASKTNTYDVTLSYTSGIYQDLNAEYRMGGGSLYLAAALTPKTARVKFISDVDDTSITLWGISYYTGFDLRTNSFTVKEGYIDISTKWSDNETNYIYGFYTKGNNRGFKENECGLRILNGSIIYEKVMPESMLNAGNSGYLTIPSETINKGWSAESYEDRAKRLAAEDVSCDLGLSVNWCCGNVGAMTDEGVYKHYSTGSTHSWSSVADEISTELGGKYRLPTYEETKEFCTSVKEIADLGYLVNGCYCIGLTGNVIYLVGMYGYSTGESYRRQYWTSSDYGSNTKRSFGVTFYNSEYSGYDDLYLEYNSSYYQLNTESGTGYIRAVCDK